MEELRTPQFMREFSQIRSLFAGVVTKTKGFPSVLLFGTLTAGQRVEAVPVSLLSLT